MPNLNLMSSIAVQPNPNRLTIDKIGALAIDGFLPKAERKSLAAALDTLPASPTFASWREGASLDIDDWLTPNAGLWCIGRLQTDADCARVLDGIQ